MTAAVRRTPHSSAVVRAVLELGSAAVAGAAIALLLVSPAGERMARDLVHGSRRVRASRAEDPLGLENDGTPLFV